MGLLAKSVWIFTLVFLAFTLVFLFPSPSTIGLMIIFVSVLAVIQTIVVLKDNTGTYEALDNTGNGEEYRP